MRAAPSRSVGGDTFPIWLALHSVNQRLASSTGATPGALELAAVGVENSVTTPAVVMRATLDVLLSANQRLPSGPVAIPIGREFAVGIGNSVNVPAVVMRPILPVPLLVNHSAPSEPETTDS